MSLFASRPVLAVAGLVLVACTGPQRPSGEGANLAEDQAALTPDTAQARLWREVAASGAAAGLQGAHYDAGQVRQREPLVVSDRAVVSRAPQLSEKVETGFVMLSAPEVELPYQGAAVVRAAEGQSVTLDLGEQGTLMFEAKVLGRALRASPGDTAQLFFRQGNPLARDDVLALRLADDDLIHALVGSLGPVEFSVPSHAMTVAQVGRVEGSTMAVAVSMGRERHVLRQGERADFQSTGLTVSVVASLALQGPVAYAIEGRPHRVQLIAWRTPR